MRALTIIAILLASLLGISVLAQPPSVPPVPFHDSLRGTTPIDEEPPTPLIFPTENKDVIRGLNYAQQPPTIPHKIDNYQVDKNANKCLSCHARSRAEESGAVPVAISHYIDRAGEVSGHLSPRRYFCTQCHVPQADTKLLIGNTFVAVEDIKTQSPPQKSKNR
jgi:nitrate reductase (cytochrome), electron transfer subunit